MSKTPAYRQLYSELKSDIKNGKYPPGTFLPTESELEQIFGVSRTTVRRAIGILTTEGYLSVKQGRGTEVQEVSTSQRLNTITSFTETIQRRGYTVTTQGLSVEQIPAPKYICDIFSLKEGELVHHIQRVQCADGQPISIIENFLLVSMFPDLQLSERNFVSLYAHLEEHYGIALQEATETITAIAASFTESQILRVPINTPLLLDKRITYTNNKPFEYAIIKVLADRYEYKVFLSGRG